MKKHLLPIGIFLTLIAIWTGICLFTHNFDVSYGYDRMAGGILTLIAIVPLGLGLIFYLELKD